MKKIITKMPYVLSIFIFTIISFKVYGDDRAIAESKISRANGLYESNLQYETRSQEIREILRKALSLIGDARQNVRKEKFLVAQKLAEEAINMLKTIPQKLRTGEGALTPSSVQDRIARSELIFERMKKYFTSGNVADLFNTVNDKIRRAKHFLAQNNYRLADNYSKEALKLLFNIPVEFNKKTQQYNQARGKLFEIQVKTEYTKLRYASYEELAGEYKKINSFILRGERSLEEGNYNSVHRDSENAMKILLKLPEMVRQIEERRRIAANQCKQAQSAIQIATDQRTLNSQQLMYGAMTDSLRKGDIALSIARNEMASGRCADALASAVKAAEYYISITLLRKKSGKLRSACATLIKEIEKLLVKAKSARLPFDTIDQIEKAKKDLEKGRSLIGANEIEEAYNVLNGTSIILKSILR